MGADEEEIKKFHAERSKLVNAYKTSLKQLKKKKGPKLDYLMEELENAHILELEEFDKRIPGESPVKEKKKTEKLPQGEVAAPLLLDLPTLSHGNITTMSTTQLKEACAERLISKSGNKEALVTRLLNWDPSVTQKNMSYKKTDVQADDKKKPGKSQRKAKAEVIKEKPVKTEKQDASEESESEESSSSEEESSEEDEEDAMKEYAGMTTGIGKPKKTEEFEMWEAEEIQHVSRSGKRGGRGRGKDPRDAPRGKRRGGRGGRGGSSAAQTAAQAAAREKEIKIAKISKIVEMALMKIVEDGPVDVDDIEEKMKELNIEGFAPSLMGYSSKDEWLCSLHRQVFDYDRSEQTIAQTSFARDLDSEESEDSEDEDSEEEDEE